MSSAKQLWQQLQQQGLVTGDMPPLSELNSPWYVRVMLGVAGWIGALFLLGFVGAFFSEIIKSSEASMIVGLGTCAVAYGLFRQLGNNDFGAQFGLAVSMAGQGLFIFGLFKAFDLDTVMIGFIIFAFQALLAILIPNAIHRTLMSWSAMLALAFALMRLDIYGLAAGLAALGFAIIWSQEVCWAKHGQRWRPIGYGLALALLQIETLNFFWNDLHDLWADNQTSWLMLHAPMIGTTLVALTFLWVITRLLNREKFPLNSSVGGVAIGAAIVLGVLSFVAHGMVTALLILLLGFATGNRVLMGLGLSALGGFLSHYYYQLNHTLLFKSLVLALSGGLLLIICYSLQKYFPLTASKENPDA